MVSVHSNGVEAMVSLAVLPKSSSNNFQSPKKHSDQDATNDQRSPTQLVLADLHL